MYRAVWALPFGRLPEPDAILVGTARVIYDSGDDSRVGDDLSNCENCLGGRIKMMGGCGRAAKHQGALL
ncbi:hypothetical protein GW17_00029479 [Ensete ventricosum]|nr:hypothetical protein GW17_00029479 [Ensete ventricosum]